MAEKVLTDSEVLEIVYDSDESFSDICSVFVTDYNHNMGGVNLKHQLLYMYMVKRKKLTKWYLRLFKKLLNSTVLNSFFVSQQVTGRNIQQLLYRIQLVEGLFTKYARAAETRSVLGRQASENTVPRLTERHFLRKVAPKTEKSKPHRRCDVWCWRISLSYITRSSITEVMPIILLRLYSVKISLLKF
jgi:hypothetical protein